MTALILDTAGEVAFLALSKEGLIISSQTFPSKPDLSKLLLPSISKLLRGTPDYICVGTGPGSYTGTRIGGLIAKTLAFAWKIPLIPFSSTLLPDLSAIGKECYEKFKNKEISQLELVYFSPTP